MNTLFRLLSHLFREVLEQLEASNAVPESEKVQAKAEILSFIKKEVARAWKPIQQAIRDMTFNETTRTNCKQNLVKIGYEEQRLNVDLYLKKALLLEGIKEKNDYGYQAIASLISLLEKPGTPRTTLNQRKLIQFYLYENGFYGISYNQKVSIFDACDGVIWPNSRTAIKNFRQNNKPSAVAMQPMTSDSITAPEVASGVKPSAAPIEQWAAIEASPDKMQLVQRVADIIKEKSPHSPLLPYVDHIIAQSVKTWVPLAQFLFIAWKETSFGRKWYMTTKNNFGNVGNTDQGLRRSFATPIQGINALFRNLQERNRVFVNSWRPFSVLEMFSARSESDARKIIAEVEDIKQQYGWSSVADIIAKRNSSIWLVNIIQKYNPLPWFRGIYMSNTDVWKDADQNIASYNARLSNTNNIAAI